MDPGGDGESYEYVDEKEVDLRENEEKGMDDGDRLVGGKISNTRFTLDIRRDKILSGCFLSWWAGTSTDSQTRYLVVVRFKGILIRSFFFGSVFIQNLGVNQLFARDLMVVLVQDVQ